jgi:NAD/NADP transhydrogenase alpha subunit
VEAFDIRPAVKEEVQSLGAKFVEVQLNEDTVAAGGYAKEISEASKQRTQEVVAEHVKHADVVITTAQVPGKKAPILVTEEMVAQMKPGSVIVDLAAEQGVTAPVPIQVKMSSGMASRSLVRLICLRRCRCMLARCMPRTFQR